jgi:hypothetical protein
LPVKGLSVTGIPISAEAAVVEPIVASELPIEEPSRNSDPGASEIDRPEIGDASRLATVNPDTPPAGPWVPDITLPRSN